jgi:hypothetical protein
MVKKLRIKVLCDDDILKKIKKDKKNFVGLKNKKKKQKVVVKIKNNFVPERYCEIEKIYSDLENKFEKLIKDDDYKNGKIYKIICSETNLIYIGSTTKDLDKRFLEHKQLFESSRSLCNLHNSFEKYGIKNHHISLVENIPCNFNTQLTLREDYHIIKNDSINNGLNSILNNPTESKIYYKCANVDNMIKLLKKYSYLKIQRQILHKLFPKDKYIFKGKTIIFMIKLNGKFFIHKTNGTLLCGINLLYGKGMKFNYRNKYKNSKFINELAKYPVYKLKLYILEVLEKKDLKYASLLMNHYMKKYDTIKNGYNSN